MEIKNTTLDDLSAVIGFSATVRLSAWYGEGNNLYVPNEINEESFLAKLIGLPAATRLSAEWAGEHLAIPRLDSYERDVRAKLISRMAEQKFNTHEIANHLRLSERRVQQIIRELEAAGLIDVMRPAPKNPKIIVTSVFDLGK